MYEKNLIDDFLPDERYEIYDIINTCSPVVQKLLIKEIMKTYPYFQKFFNSYNESLRKEEINM